MSSFLSSHSLYYSVLIFAASALSIGYFGIKMTYIARDLAKASGLGEALMGAVFIGATTSLSGIVASGTAAFHGEASLAISNSLGGIAAQTLFLVLADLVYRKANLEFAAASVENLMMSAQLMLLLCIVLFAFVLPEFYSFSFHPASLILIIAYLFTVKLLVDTHRKPMWLPRMSRGTVVESRQSDKSVESNMTQLILGFLACALVVAFCGWAISSAGMELVNRTELSSGVVGGIFIAVSTSLPELVIAITAVRLGSLTLAVGDIVGGNAFDTLFIAISDFLYIEGSIYVAVSNQEFVWLGTAMLMNCLLLLGLMYRERKGVASIGMESFLTFLVYISTVTFLILSG